MDQENRQCQNCKQEFTIEPEDFDFYKKIEVPPPTAPKLSTASSVISPK